jgi:hypothetical protein
MSAPFMEHPTGNFNTAIEAMEDAVRRLRELPEWKEWITFSAQGEGHDPDSYEFAEVRMRGDTLDVGGGPLPLDSISRASGVARSALAGGADQYSVAGASPNEVARLLDAVFRHHFGIRPFAVEGDDYAVGAEW